MKWQIGTIGYGYKQWQGAFYPAKMRPNQYLTHYAQFFDTVEIDSTFYGIPKASHVKAWRDRVPADFIFCPKTPKSISHHYLPHTENEMRRFIETMRHLDDKLGVFLVQFPPSFKLNHADSADALKRFANQLPIDVRFAFEFRDASWDRQKVRDWMAKHNFAWVCADYVHLEPRVFVSADFIYYRFIGKHQQFSTKDHERVDQTDRLQGWLDQSTDLSHISSASITTPPKTAFAFFNNDFSGHSPATANRLKKLVGLDAYYPEIASQASLF